MATSFRIMKNIWPAAPHNKETTHKWQSFTVARPTNKALSIEAQTRSRVQRTRGAVGPRAWCTRRNRLCMELTAERVCRGA